MPNWNSVYDFFFNVRRGAAAAVFDPSDITGLVYEIDLRTGVTLNGADISAVADQSGEGNDQLQASAGAQPLFVASPASALFDGVDHFMETAGFTLNQPFTRFILFKQITWTANRYIGDGASEDVTYIYQSGVSPNLKFGAGGSELSNNGLVLDTYGVLTIIGDGASSAIIVNDGTPVTGNAGAGNPGGLALGSNGIGGGPSNIQVKADLAYDSHLSAADITSVTDYLNSI